MGRCLWERKISNDLNFYYVWMGTIYASWMLVQIQNFAISSDRRESFPFFTCLRNWIGFE
jgi:hypothetical protein